MGLRKPAQERGFVSTYAHNREAPLIWNLVYVNCFDGWCLVLLIIWVFLKMVLLGCGIAFGFAFVCCIHSHSLSAPLSLFFLLLLAYTFLVYIENT